MATGFSPNQTIGSVFSIPSGCPTTSASTTLLRALELKGGKILCGARETLLRAAVAALLNSADPTVDYALSTAEVISQVNIALASGDRKTILALAEQLDVLNNRGCPLN